jgi:hypothetical protein
MPSILDLPYEIRLLIYEQVYTKPERIVCVRDVYFNLPSFRPSISISFLLTCRQINREAGSVLWNSNRFLICDTSNKQTEYCQKIVKVMKRHVTSIVKTEYRNIPGLLLLSSARKEPDLTDDGDLVNPTRTVIYESGCQDCAGKTQAGAQHDADATLVQLPF